MSDPSELLEYALALILIVVGIKMIWLNGAFGGNFPIGRSLGIIAVLLISAIFASLVRRPAERHGGAA